MTDLSATVAPKSDQLNADDLISGAKTIIITDVRGVGGDQPIAIHFEGDNGKPFKPCKSMRRVFIKAWGADGKQYKGRSVTLYCDPSVKFGGIAVGGIRISHMSHIEQDFEMPLTVSRAQRRAFHVKQLKVEQSSEVDFSAILEAGESASTGGIEAYKTWFGEQSNEIRRKLQDSGKHDDFKAIATEADEQKSKSDF